MKVSVIIPTFNEKDNIVLLARKVIEYVKKSNYECEVVVVDDNSPDKTGEICKRTFANSNEVSTYIRKKDKGFASAIYYGIMKSKGDIVIVMDSDFSHDPKLIPVMLRKIKKYDIVIGSRYAKNGGGENKQRFWLSKIYNEYLKFLLEINVSDFLFGYFCIKKSYLLKNKLINKDIFKGFGDYFIRFAYFIDKANGSFCELPVFYKNRIHGQSKSNLVKMLITYTITSLKIYNLKITRNRK